MTDRDPALNAALRQHAAGAALVRKGMAMMEAAARTLCGLGDPGDNEVGQLTVAAAERGHRVTGDGFVTERAAADLLAKAPGTLRQWRAEHEPIPWRRGAGGRVEYSLVDMAAFMALRRKQGAETR